MTRSFALPALLFAFVLALSHSGSVAWAQEKEATSESNVPALGFVRLNKIFSESKYVEGVRLEVTDEFAEREAAWQEKVDEFQVRKEQLESNQLAQTAAQKEGEVNAVNELEREIKREERNISEAKRERFEKANRDVEAMISITIQEVASSHEIYVVLELSSVLFAEKRLDLTDEVIAALDTKKAAAGEEQADTQ